uniref:Uncharacterized protein n=1 Tax=Arundo donax TaxID=35708 RepID=A0A0A9HPJ6_ARUDO
MFLASACHTSNDGCVRSQNTMWL